MIKRKDLLAMSFYEKSPFTGSEGTMNYRVEKITQKTADGEGEEKLLQATIWPGPWCFSLTEEEKKQRHTAPFSDEGLEMLVEWMNEQARFLNGEAEHTIM